jgi:hypothetical protein
MRSNDIGDVRSLSVDALLDKAVNGRSDSRTVGNVLILDIVHNFHHTILGVSDSLLHQPQCICHKFNLREDFVQSLLHFGFQGLKCLADVDSRSLNLRFLWLLLLYGSCWFGSIHSCFGSCLIGQSLLVCMLLLRNIINFGLVSDK